MQAADDSVNHADTFLFVLIDYGLMNSEWENDD